MTAHAPSTAVGRPSVSRVWGMATPSTSTSPVRSCARTQRDEPSSPTSCRGMSGTTTRLGASAMTAPAVSNAGQPAQHRLGRRQHGHPPRLELGQRSRRRDPRRDVRLRRRQARLAVVDLGGEEPHVVAVALHLRGHPVVDDRQDRRVHQQPALVVAHRDVDAGLLRRLADRAGVERGDADRVGAAALGQRVHVAGDEVHLSRRSMSSTRPPGKTCMRGANAMVVARRMRNVSSPSSPSRSSTTVAAGRTGPLT